LRQRRIIGLFVAFLGVLAVGFFLRRAEEKPVEKSRFLFGTLIRITAYGPGAASGVDRALAEMERIHGLTAQNEGLVALINERAGQSPVPVGEELFNLLEKIFRLAEETKGYFNPVIGSLVELWDFDYEGKGRLPSPEEIRSVLPLTQREQVVLDEERQTVFLKQAGMKLDLSGVAKGYAVDRAWAILKEAGVTGALINGGESSIRVLGERPGGGPWRIAVSHPRRNGWIGILQLRSGQALGTSADTQRYFEENGRRYSHLLNPLTGYPPTDLMSVTVLAPSALEADLYSTAVFVAEGKDRKDFLARLGIEAVLVDADTEILVTPGMETIFKKSTGEGEE